MYRVVSIREKSMVVGGAQHLTIQSQLIQQEGGYGGNEILLFLHAKSSSNRSMSGSLYHGLDKTTNTTGRTPRVVT